MRAHPLQVCTAPISAVNVLKTDKSTFVSFSGGSQSGSKDGKHQRCLQNTQRTLTCATSAAKRERRQKTKRKCPAEDETNSHCSPSRDKSVDDVPDKGNDSRATQKPVHDAAAADNGESRRAATCTARTNLDTGIIDVASASAKALREHVSAGQTDLDKTKLKMNQHANNGK